MDEGTRERKDSIVKRFVRRCLRALRDRRGVVNTTDLLIAAGGTIILASVVAASAVDSLNQPKFAKTQHDGGAMVDAILKFFADTGKFPGQADHSASTTSGAATGTLSPLLLVSAPLTTTDLTTASLPDTSGTADSYGNEPLTITANATCQNNSLEGFVNKSIEAGTVTTSSSGPAYAAFVLKNINKYLVSAPSSTAYPNWKGPYMTTEVTVDGWDRAWVINLMPLYCSESVVAGGNGTAGELGYAWLLSGGPNRTISTGFQSPNLDTSGDDAGANLGKLAKVSSGS